MLAMALTLCAGTASADHFGIYTANDGLDCALEVVPTGVPFGVHVIHKFNAGAGAAQFRVVDTTGFLALNQTTIAGLALGAWNTDWSIAYGAACLQGDLLIATLNFLSLGGVVSCPANGLSLLDAPTSPVPGSIALVNCGGDFETGSGGTLWVGANAQTCVSPTGCDPSAVSQTTWGGVKALYR
jgi:hypothetical protein